MALFGSKTKEKQSVKKIRPTVVRTQNVAKELLSLAKSHNTSPDSLDFNLLEVQTFTRINDGTRETDWKEISYDDLDDLDKKETLLNPEFQMKQVYEVEIFSKKTEDDPYKEFKLAVGANATKCKVYISIGAGSKVKYSEHFEKVLFLMIQKRKIRAGILINVFDKVQKETVGKVSAHVRVEEEAVYEQNETFLVAEAYEPTATINDELVLHYDKKTEIDEKTKIDYASRGFIKNVKEGEVLIEYIKAKEGKPGRNCRGEFMKPTEPVISHQPEFKIDATIDMVEDDDTIKYIAKENGYIAFEDNTYTVKTDVDVGEISFKTTGSIATGLDSDVSISVKETDAIKDAIGTGMEVEVTEIDIEGNVGSNATVNAIRANIGGQTHKTAILRADKLNINVHKGQAFGKKIHITRLEHGEADGDKIEVSQALGGHLRAKEIDIEICASYVKATASRRIEIQKLQGSENVFTIDPLLKKDAQAGLDENKENIAKLEKETRDVKKEIKEYTKLIKDGTPAFLDIKKRLLHYKKSGVKMPDSFVKKYKQFQNMQEHLKEIKNESAIKEDQLKLLTTRTVSFQDNIFDARIINRGKWAGHNELRFRLVDPEIELVYKPKENSTDHVFGLVEVDDGEFEIQAVKE